MAYTREKYPFFPGDNNLPNWQAHFNVEDPQSIEGSVTYHTAEDESDNRYRIKSLTPPPPEGVQIGADLNPIPFNATP